MPYKYIHRPYKGILSNELLKTDHGYLVAIVSCNVLHFIMIYIQDTNSKDLNVFFRNLLLTIYSGFLHSLTDGGMKSLVIAGYFPVQLHEFDAWYNV